MKNPRLLNLFATKNLATDHHPSGMVSSPLLSGGSCRLHSSGLGPAAPARAPGVVSVCFPASTHPSPHLSEHRWCFREGPTGTLRFFIQRAIESPALSMNAGVIFLPCVAYCFILLHFTPLPSPISQPSCVPWRPSWLGTPSGLQGTLSAEGMRKGRRGKQSRCSPRTAQGCHINKFPGGAPHCRCSNLGCCATSPPGSH